MNKLLTAIFIVFYFIVGALTFLCFSDAVLGFISNDPITPDMYRSFWFIKGFMFMLICQFCIKQTILLKQELNKLEGKDKEVEK
jgi:phosphotransferase system  glucose/maltose/N-acetylglucosamine-specific IIC component